MNFLEKYNLIIKNYDLLLDALTHSSYSNEHGCDNYERLEYLGDAVLQVIISEYLFINTDLQEGAMSKKRASYVCEKALATYAKDVGFIPYIRVGHGQVNDVNDTIIADIFESVLGVVYLEFGFDAAKKYIYKVVIPYIENNTVFLDDYKSLLQEMVQTTKEALKYVVISETGPSHDKLFVVDVMIDNIKFGTGRGKSKKEAEQRAAEDAYNKRAVVGEKNVFKRD